jgi:hypothetical protein
MWWHACTPTYLEGGDVRITDQGQKVSETMSQDPITKLGMVAHAYGFSYAIGRGMRITV